MKSKRLHHSIFFFLAIFLIQLDTAQAAYLHAIIVCDTHADGIEKSVKADYKNIRREIRKIRKYARLKTRIKKFTGSRVDSDFLDAVKELEVDPDDVVLFYYSGHGIRFESQEDPWPEFDLEHDSQKVSLYTVTQELMSKNPRLILSIADCCNDFSGKSLPVQYKSSTKALKENYRALFLYSSGTYIAAGASPGEASFGLNGSSKYLDLPAGGFFTNAFLEVLHEETAESNPDIGWELVFEGAVQRTIEYQLRDEYDPYVYHTPMYEYYPN